MTVGCSVDIDMLTTGAVVAMAPLVNLRVFVNQSDGHE